MRKSEYKERKRQRKLDIQVLKKLHYSNDQIEEYINSPFYKMAMHNYLIRGLVNDN